MRALILVLASSMLLGGCFETTTPAATVDAAPRASAGSRAEPAAPPSIPQGTRSAPIAPPAPPAKPSSDELDAGTPDIPELPREPLVPCDDDDAGVCQPAVIDIGTMCSSTCVLMRDRTVRCWGAGSFGAFEDDGNERQLHERVPTQIKYLRNVREISVGCVNACVLQADGNVGCWGSANLGDGTSSSNNNAVTVAEIADATQVTAGDAHHCAVLRDGTMRCWGFNAFGALGDGTSGVYPLLPTTVKDLSDVVRAVSGYGRNYAWRRDGSLYAWGSEKKHYLLGTPEVVEDVLAPVEITTYGEVAQLTNGYGHTCALRPDGSVRCWGFNSYGQLGAPTAKSEWSAMTAPEGLPQVTQISAGFDHVCAVVADATVRCWGRNDFGQVGDGTQKNAAIPTKVIGLSNVAKVAAGMDHTCALLHDGAVYCWGRNDRGMMGTGEMSKPQLTPVAAWGLGHPRR